MISLLCFAIGLSFSLNLSLIAFIVFIFKKNENQIYDKFDNKIEEVKMEKDPFKDL